MRGRRTTAVLALAGAAGLLGVSASPAAAGSCAEFGVADLMGSGDPVVVGVALGERADDGTTPVRVDEVWFGPDPGGRVRVRTGQVQPGDGTMVASSGDLDLEPGLPYVLQLVDGAAGLCSALPLSAVPEPERPADLRAPGVEPAAAETWSDFSATGAAVPDDAGSPWVPAAIIGGGALAAALLLMAAVSRLVGRR